MKPRRPGSSSNFQPHLTPQIRGIEVTIYATLNKDISNDELYELYQKYYKDEYFVHVYPASKPVQTKWTAGTNCAASPPPMTPAPSACW